MTLTDFITQVDSKVQQYVGCSTSIEKYRKMLNIVLGYGAGDEWEIEYINHYKTICKRNSEFSKISGINIESHNYEELSKIFAHDIVIERCYKKYMKHENR